MGCFPKIKGTFLGAPIIRTIVYLGLYWGPLILGNYHMSEGTLARGFFGRGRHSQEETTRASKGLISNYHEKCTAWDIDCALTTFIHKSSNTILSSSHPACSMQR